LDHGNQYPGLETALGDRLSMPHRVFCEQEQSEAVR
jgi:hypothetical protein